MPLIDFGLGGRWISRCAFTCATGGLPVHLRRAVTHISRLHLRGRMSVRFALRTLLVYRYFRYCLQTHMFTTYTILRALLRCRFVRSTCTAPAFAHAVLVAVWFVVPYVLRYYTYFTLRSAHLHTAPATPYTHCTPAHRCYRVTALVGFARLDTSLYR